MSDANNWKWISSPPDYVRNLVEELRVKGEERAAEMFKNYVEELHFKHAENVMLEAKYDFLYIENKRLKAELEEIADMLNRGPDSSQNWDVKSIYDIARKALEPRNE